MKSVLIASLVVAVTVWLAPARKAFASTNDTLTVYASGPAINQVINGDTTADGQQAHNVYRLVSTDTTYIFLNQITPKSSITVLGVEGPNGRPPCIQPGVLNDGSIPPTLFNINRKAITATFKNLLIEGLATDGSFVHPAYGIQVTADSVRLYVDNVVFSDVSGCAIVYTGNWGNYFITDCTFRDNVDPVTWTDASALEPLWPAIAAVDSIVMNDNTFFCDNSAEVVAKYPVRYVGFSHNSVVFSFMQPFFIMASENAKIDNNIFYDTFVGGELKSQYPWWDEEFSPATPAIISFDTMNVASDRVFDPQDSTKPNWRMLAEAKRVVQVENNDFYEESTVTNFWTSWNDTSKAGDPDSLYTPTFMNSRTENMFNDKTAWPGFTQSGNISVNPDYGASFANVLKGGGNYGIGLLPYFSLINSQKSPTIGWGYQIQSISNGNSNWIPYWPLPEAADMQYTNAAVKNASNDGIPLGDPVWFNKVTAVMPLSAQVPTKFDLSNNYPNPFNPSTVIKVTLANAGNMSLEIYNVLGQLVKVVAQGYKAPGVYTYNVFMDNFASGVYFYRLQEGSRSMTKKMLLLK